MKIYHIYWGTSGNSGLYLDEIYQVLKSNGFEQRVFVNYYYPFNYGNKIFFKRGDIGNSKYKGALRKIFQLLEILKGYCIILAYAIKERPKVINYSHAALSYFFVRLFLKLLKFTSGAKLIITCHDVACHFSGGELNRRKKIFNIPNYLLVHTDKSIEELNTIFCVPKRKILKHLFPIMDLKKLSFPQSDRYTGCDVLFIGSLRKDKGIEFLVDTWKQYHQINTNAKLRICGKFATGVNIDVSDLANYNIELIEGFVPDLDYPDYVVSSRYVILPYLEGTNSGIISTVLSLGADVITSDLPMFSENYLVDKNNMFVTGDSISLIDLLEKKLNGINKKPNEKLSSYRMQFNDEVLQIYNKLDN